MVPSNCLDSSSATDDVDHKPVTWEETKAIANKLARFPQVISVEVFGDSSLCPPAEEASLILIVNQELLYQRFISETRRRVEEDSPSIFPETLHRKFAVAFVLGEDLFWDFLNDLDTEMDHYELSLLLNLYIFPSNWRNRLDEIQENLSFEFESSFMRRVSQGARVLVRHVK